MEEIIDAGDCPEPKVSKIWSAVYTDVKGLPDMMDRTQMLFTVAVDQLHAEEAFGDYLFVHQGCVYDNPSPDSIDALAMAGDSVGRAVKQLHDMGYTFVFPCREDVDDHEGRIAQLVSVLLF